MPADPAWLASVLAGEPDHEAVERMARGITTWLRSGGQRGTGPSLYCCLGLPPRPEAARLALRDHWLRRAADELPEHQQGPWTRATALHAALGAFRGHRWACWHDLHQPPPYAEPLEAALWHAHRAAGGRMPTTARRISQILSLD